MSKLYGYVSVAKDLNNDKQAIRKRVLIEEAFYFLGYELFTHINWRGLWCVTEKRSGAKVCTNTKIKDFLGHTDKESAIRTAKDNISNYVHHNGNMDKLIDEFCSKIVTTNEVDVVKLKMLNLI